MPQTQPSAPARRAPVRLAALPFKTKPQSAPSEGATTQPFEAGPTSGPAQPGQTTGVATSGGATGTGTTPATVVPADERVPPPTDLTPLGYTAGMAHHALQGPVRANPYETDFLPIMDRWRVGLPAGYQQNVTGDLIDPYNQNVLKGDYAVPGTQDVFLLLTGTSDTLYENRTIPTPSDLSSENPGKLGFFGQGRSQFVQQNFILSGELFQGDASYQPKNFVFRATAVSDLNFLQTGEYGAVSPDPREGSNRTDAHVAMQELFVEKKLADLSSNYDFVSVRAGIQGFSSDFRGFLFSDNEPGVRLFGNYDNNRWQYNLAWFYQLEKDTNSGLNTFNGRDQNVFIANLFRQDLFVPGYTGQLSFHANIDQGKGLQYDRNGFLVRPAPVGTVQAGDIYAYYFGWAGDGHIGRFNITHQFYQVFGNDTFSQIAGRPVTIDAQMAAIELSYDEDYARFRTSFVYLSGDRHPQGHNATGFDTIMDDPNIAGGGTSYFIRQGIPLVGSGVSLVGPNSLTPDLRTSKTEGQANFVNPGLFLYNVGADFKITPKLTLISNATYLQFDNTSSIQYILQDGRIRKDIGLDLSLGLEYRPFLNNNVIINAGAACLVPGNGFKDIYTSETLYSLFISTTLTY